MTGRKPIKYAPTIEVWRELNDLAGQIGCPSLSALISLVIHEQLPALRKRAKKQRRERAAA